MNADLSWGQASDERSSRKTLIVTALSTVGFLILLYDLAGGLVGGGIYSIISATRAAREKVGVVDVDAASLRTAFAILWALAVVPVGLKLKDDFSDKSSKALVAVVIIFGAFIIDMILGGAIIDSSMAHYGYHRCKAADHNQGYGKSRIWFHDYVLADANCLARPG